MTPIPLRTRCPKTARRYLIPSYSVTNHAVASLGERFTKRIIPAHFPSTRELSQQRTENKFSVHVPLPAAIARQIPLIYECGLIASLRHRKMPTLICRGFAADIALSSSAGFEGGGQLSVEAQ